jgi:putative endonuclease
VKYVYILQSEQDAEHFYIGITDDLEARLSKHNSGAVTHTAKHRPWRTKSYVAFADKARASAFEKYLKSGSGRAFAKATLQAISPTAARSGRQNCTNTRVAHTTATPKPSGGGGPVAPEP